MSLVLALAMSTSAIQAPPEPPPASATRPVACVHDRLDRPYLSHLWQRVIGEGVDTADPLLVNFNSAVVACQQEHGWPRDMAALAGFYALARAHGDAMLQQNLSVQADRNLLARGVMDFAPAYFEILSRNGASDFSTEAKGEFRAFLERSQPDLLRRFDYEDLWAAAMPRLVAEAMHVRFAMFRDLG